MEKLELEQEIAKTIEQFRQAVQRILQGGRELEQAVTQFLLPQECSLATKKAAVKWCRENGYLEPEFSDGIWWGYASPNDVMKVPLPPRAQAELV